MPEEQPQAYRPVTDEDKAQLTAALERTNGNRRHAALMLQWDEKRVHNMIQHHADLNARWSTRPAQVELSRASDLDRPPTEIAQFSPDAIKAAEALANQDAIMMKSWEKAGFDEKQRNFLHTLQSSYAIPLKNTLDLTYGGAVHIATRLLLQIESLCARLKDVEDNPDKYERVHVTEFGENVVKNNHEFYLELYDRLIATCGEFRKVNTDVTKAAYVRAQLEQLKQGNGGKPTKPGWSTQAPPAAVTINMGNSKAKVKISSPQQPDPLEIIPGDDNDLDDDDNDD